MPIDISTADTTRSMIRKGSAIRKPISKARWISDSMKDGISTDNWVLRSPEPGAASFVEVGQRVKKDQVLCIIEAMKLMNEITSEFDGELVSAYVENGKPVQYGERLFAIKTS